MHSSVGALARLQLDGVTSNRAPIDTGTISALFASSMSSLLPILQQ